MENFHLGLRRTDYWVRCCLLYVIILMDLCKKHGIVLVHACNIGGNSVSCFYTILRMLLYEPMIIVV